MGVGGGRRGGEPEELTEREKERERDREREREGEGERGRERASGAIYNAFVWS